MGKKMMMCCAFFFPQIMDPKEENDARSRTDHLLRLEMRLSLMQCTISDKRGITETRKKMIPRYGVIRNAALVGSIVITRQ